MPKPVQRPHREKARESPGSLEVPGGPWQLQAAKAPFSELFRLARTEGPQLITRQGKDGVVMMPVEQFNRLMVRARQPKNLVQFFRESPSVGVEMKVEL